jgi:HD domain-containing protein
MCPDGLAGQQIPMGARMIAVCDAFTAMTFPRPYAAQLTVAKAFAELRGAPHPVRPGGARRAFQLRHQAGMAAPTLNSQRQHRQRRPCRRPRLNPRLLQPLSAAELPRRPVFDVLASLSIDGGAARAADQFAGLSARASWLRPAALAR